MKKIIFAFLLLAGCNSTNYTTVFFPAGDIGYQVNCKQNSPTDCLNKSAEICSGKYKILDQYNQWSNQPVISSNILIMCGN